MRQGVTGLNCAGFGSAMVVTASFGMVAAAQVLQQAGGEGVTQAPITHHELPVTHHEPARCASTR